MEPLRAALEPLLDGLVTEMAAVLGDDLTGLYLYGSAMTGGFDPGVSDLDLAAVTGPDVRSIDLSGIERMHRAFATAHPAWQDRIEVVYAGREALASFRTSPGPLAVISPGEPFHLRREAPVEWLQNWYLLRETGVALRGPEPAQVVPPISTTEFVAATAHYAGVLGRRNLDGAGSGSIAYTLLTLCRAVATVSTRRPVSKQEGAAWAAERRPEWAWLIEAALACRLTRGRSGFDDQAARAAARRLVGLLTAEIEAVAAD